MARPSSPVTAPTHSSRGMSSARHRTSSSSTNLVNVAIDSRRRVHWDQILRGRKNASQWKWIENVRNFAVYTRQQRDNPVKDVAATAVLAIGVVKGSVPEVASLLSAFTHQEYIRKMAAICEDDFKHGVYVGDVPVDVDDPAVMNARLSVRTATFAKAGGWLSNGTEEWCYLNTSSMDKEAQRFEQVLTSLRPDDLKAIDSKISTASGKHIQGLLVAYRVEQNLHQDGQSIATTDDDTDATNSSATPSTATSTRVHFYAENNVPSSSRLSRLSFGSTKSSVSDKSVQLRMLQFAKQCDRLTHLVRRRRLGVQLLIDQKRILTPLKSKCFNCDTNLHIVAKLCRVCGQGVCSDCSAKYERESHHVSSGTNYRVLLEDVRVCDPCLARVEHANYAEITDEALAWQAVFPNSPQTKPAAADLKDLLQDALLQAPSPKRKASVVSVIRCVLDQERGLTPPLSTGLEAVDEIQVDSNVILTPVSVDAEYVDALDYIDVKNIPYTDVEVAAKDGRAFALDSRQGDPATSTLPYPVPENEAQRVAAIADSHLLDSGTVEELNIICEIAAKETGTFCSLISLITADEQRVIGASAPPFAELILGREHSFCQHAIMDDKPLIVSYPEADVRFSKIVPVTAMGARYYCGFPIVADDNQNTVIGSLCCIDNKRNSMNESQFAVLRKLAQTASKVVKLEGQRRRRAMSNEAPTA